MEQNAPPPTLPETARQSPCPSNWSDYLLTVDSETDNDKDNENQKQADPPTNENNMDQPSMSTGTRIPQNLKAHSDTTLRLPHSTPKALLIQKEREKGKRHSSEETPVVVYDNTNPSWEQLPSPSPPKTRPPYATWGKTKPKRQTQTDKELK